VEGIEAWDGQMSEQRERDATCRRGCRLPSLVGEKDRYPVVH
jgi:hypothetical protein